MYPFPLSLSFRLYSIITLFFEVNVNRRKNVSFVRTSQQKLCPFENRGISIIIIIITAVEFSLGGSSPYTSTDKTNNIYKRNNTKTQYKQYKNTVQTIQSTVNTSTHITKTPTHNETNTHTTKQLSLFFQRTCAFLLHVASWQSVCIKKTF